MCVLVNEHFRVLVNLHLWLLINEHVCELVNEHFWLVWHRPRISYSLTSVNEHLWLVWHRPRVSYSVTSVNEHFWLVWHRPRRSYSVTSVNEHLWLVWHRPRISYYVTIVKQYVVLQKKYCEPIARRVRNAFHLRSAGTTIVVSTNAHWRIVHCWSRSYYMLGSARSWHSILLTRTCCKFYS